MAKVKAKAGAKVGATVAIKGKAAPKRPLVKQAAAPVVASTLLAGPRREGDDLYFSPLDLRLVELAQLRASEARGKIDVLKALHDRSVADAQKQIESLKQGIAKQVADYQGRAKEVDELYQEIERVYGVSMRQIAYHPETGLISRPE